MLAGLAPAGLLALFVASVAMAQSPIERTATCFYWPTGSSDLGNYAGWLSDSCSWSGNDNYTRNEYHLGVDIAADEGDAVYAIARGKVLRISTGGWGAGNVGVLVEHRLCDGTSFLAIYGHVRSAVVVGDELTAGLPFAVTGPWSPPHLHFAIRPGTSIASPYGGMPCPASGPITDTNGFVDPIRWITTLAPVGCSEAVDSDPVGADEPTDSDSLGPDEVVAELTPQPESHLEREARMIRWLQLQCAGVGAALIWPLLASAAFSRRRI